MLWDRKFGHEIWNCLRGSISFNIGPIVKYLSSLVNLDSNSVLSCFYLCNHSVWCTKLFMWNGVKCKGEIEDLDSNGGLVSQVGGIQRNCSCAQYCRQMGILWGLKYILVPFIGSGKVCGRRWIKKSSPVVGVIPTYYIPAGVLAWLFKLRACVFDKRNVDSVDMRVVDCLWVIETLVEDVGMQRVAFCGWCLSNVDNSR